MSDDIVKRLREGTFGSDETKTDCVINAHMHRAADEIERLRADLAAERGFRAETERQLQDAFNKMGALLEDRDKLREALEPFAIRNISDKAPDLDTVPVFVAHLRRARAVLEETKGGGDE
jgi:hypothetical protein